MNLIEQCQQWNEQDEFQKIIDAIETIPADQRTPELDSELARAYNNLAEPTDRHLFQKSLALLKPHENYFKGDHCWNFRIAYAYYYLEQEGRALRYFRQALDARPGDEDTQQMIEACRKDLSLPRFNKTFRERTEKAWAAFEREEARLRKIMREDIRHERSKELISRCERVLSIALSDTAFELGCQKDRYELVLSPEGERMKLFPLVYFQQHAPASVRKNWDIIVGRQKNPHSTIRIDEYEVKGKDVDVWIEQIKGKQVVLTLYCEKLLPLLKENENKAWWMVANLMSHELGEIAYLSLIRSFELAATPKKGISTKLSVLSDALKAMNLPDYKDAEEFLIHNRINYNLSPEEDKNADWRLDVFTGSACVPALINGYLSAEPDAMDELHQDGIVAGFFIYPAIEAVEGEERTKQMQQLRDDLQEKIRKQAGDDVVAFLGGATGLYCGYLDFMAWDLRKLLEVAADVFSHTNLPWAYFHSFRRDVSTVRIWERTVEEEAHQQGIHPDTGSLLSAEDLRALEAFHEGATGYFGKMFSYIVDFVRKGVKEGRFTEEQARADLQIALWYSYSCINLTSYEYYYRAMQWMPDSEKNAKGCATWYYRYSCALMYCSRLEEALKYAEQGAKEEPDYPWIWLQVGKLRYYFGDKKGALEAVKQGLSLEPGDYEFLTLGREIELEASLEQMEFHWINPDADRDLLNGLDEEADDKRCTISCLTVNPEGLARFHRIFTPGLVTDYVKNSPYCRFNYQTQHGKVEVVFKMNEAGLSKLQADWLVMVKDALDDGRWAAHRTTENQEGALETIVLGLDYSILLEYKLKGPDEGYVQVWLNKDGTPVSNESGD